MVKSCKREAAFCVELKGDERALSSVVCWRSHSAPVKDRAGRADGFKGKVVVVASSTSVGFSPHHGFGLLPSQQHQCL